MTSGNATTTGIWLDHAAEFCGQNGPTGEYVQVLTGEVRDHGGNVLFAGSADECIREAATYRIPVRCVPTTWERLSSDVVGADHTWAYAVR